MDEAGSEAVAECHDDREVSPTVCTPEAGFVVVL
jgi:hypothetical protein